MPQIVARNLRKVFRVAEREAGLVNSLKSVFYRRYQEVVALDGVSFEIEPGELVGYIGPNGAGKSTTVKMLSGILVPTSGTCHVKGLTPWQNRIKHVRQIGVVFGQRTQLWWDLPVIDSFEMLRDIYRIDESRYRRSKDELVDHLNLGELLSIPVRQLSLGQRMRCELAASLLHQPEILFLDEPTIGLDAVSKLAVRNFVKKINKDRQVTVILTTHDMDDIEALCTRVLLIGKGRILLDSSVEGLRAQVADRRRLVVELASEVTQIDPHPATIIKCEGRYLHLTFNPHQITSAQLITILSQRYPIRDLFVENLPIEEVISHIYGKLSL